MLLYQLGLKHVCSRKHIRVEWSLLDASSMGRTSEARFQLQGPKEGIL